MNNDILTQLDQLAIHQDPETQDRIAKIKGELQNILTTHQWKPLSPQHIREQQIQLPGVQKVIQIVKDILLDNLQGGSHRIKQKDIVQQWQEKHAWQKFCYVWLDAMQRYFQQQWRKVSYDRPWRDENYDSNFLFEVQ